jgi:hypothetical protein
MKVEAMGEQRQTATFEMLPKRGDEYVSDL